MTIIENPILEQLRKENAELKNKIASLAEQLEWFHRQIFGVKSEKVVSPSPDQLFFPGFDVLEKKDPKEIKINTHSRKQIERDGEYKISFPANLPIERIILDLPEEQKICKETNIAYVKIGEDVTQKLSYKPGNYYIKEIVRLKYVHPKREEAGVISAALPNSFLPKSRIDESFIAQILTMKFNDHLPLNRITEILGREEVEISRQLLSQWVMRVGTGLKPLFDEMIKKILQSSVLHVDETPVDMQDPGKGKVHQGYMWLAVGGQEVPYVAYQFKMDRKHINAEELLKGYKGVVHSDKYGAYEKLATSKQIIWAPCWSHIRRKFFEANTDQAFQKLILRKIKYLFMLERVAWARSKDERIRIRLEKEVPIIDELISLIKNKLMNGHVLPKSKLREALGYFCGLIPYLKNYTQNSEARLDNNVAERAARPIALGRKNWLFVGSAKGGEASAVILSFVQTCKRLNINPREYLEDILRRIMDHNSQKLDELLPDNWAKKNLDKT